MVDLPAASYSHPPVENLTIKTGGMDPSLIALMAGNKSGGGMFGGEGGLLPLLIGAFLFGGRGGLGGMFGGAGDAGGAAVAAQSLTTSKDIAAQLNTFQSWAQNNASALSTQLCTSSAAITAAVNALTPQMYQGFAAQAMQLCQASSAINQNISNGNFQIEKSLDAGFSASQLAECQTQNLVNTTACDVKLASQTNFALLSQQLAACCCENRLAIANQNALIERGNAFLSNQLNVQTCEIKGAITADGAATRALINDNTLNDLRTQLNDAKINASNSEQTNVLIAALGGHKT